MERQRKYNTDAEKQAAYRQRQAERIQAQIEGRIPTPPPIGNIPPERRWKALKEEAQRTLKTLQSEMQNYFDARSEEWHDTDRGEALQERINAIEEILEVVNEL